MAGDYTYSGNRIKFDLELTLLELESEANKMFDSLEIELMKSISNGEARGIAESRILDMVNNEEGFYKAFANKQKKLITSLSNQLVAKPAIQASEENPNLKFRWVLGEVKTEHCIDCFTLSNKDPRTIQEWRDLGFGLPREGKTKCNVGCKCMLIPVEETPPTDPEMEELLKKDINQMSKEEIDKYFTFKTEEIFKKLEEKEKQVLEYYKGDGYVKINGMLRKGESFFAGLPEQMKREVIMETQANIEYLDNVFKKNVLDKDYTLYRGIRKYALRDLIGEDLSVERLRQLSGTIIQDKGFMSTAALYENTQTFMESEDCIMILKAKKGLRATYLQPKQSVKETEILFNRGMKIKINRIRLRQSFEAFYPKYILEGEIIQ